MSIESGWLIERRKGPVTTWAAATESGFHWTAEAHEAIRFSRRSDAEQVASILGDDVDAICEHQWGPDLVSPPQPETAVIFHLADKTLAVSFDISMSTGEELDQVCQFLNFDPEVQALLIKRFPRNS